jgi:hypothetical protein
LEAREVAPSDAVLSVVLRDEIHDVDRELEDPLVAAAWDHVTERADRVEDQAIGTHRVLVVAQPGGSATRADLLDCQAAHQLSQADNRSESHLGATLLVAGPEPFAGQTGVDGDRAAIARGPRPVLDALLAADDQVGVWLADRNGFHGNSLNHGWHG